MATAKAIERLELRAFGRGRFSPRSLPNLVLWLNASLITGLVDGDPVTTWADLSGQGNHATQGTGAAKPLYKVGIANGRPGVLFDGVDDFMSLTAGAAETLMGAARTVFAVVKWVATLNDMRIVSASNAGGNGRFALRVGGSTLWQAVYTTGAAGANLNLSGVNNPSTSVAQIMDSVQSGASFTASVNGLLGATAVDAGVEAAGVAALGANGPGTGSFGNLYILEVVAYSAALSAADRARVRRYLGAKYSVAVS